MTDITKSGCTILYKSENGRETQIQDLNSAHLANILRKMERKAQLDFEKGQDADKWADCLPPEYDELEDEAIYRGLDWRNPKK